MILKIILSIFLIFPIVSCKKFRFDNYTLYKVVPKSVDQITILQNLQDSDSRFDFWSDPVPSADTVSILSSPSDKINLEEFFRSNGIEFGISFSNIQELIDRQTVKSYTRGNFKNFALDAYHTNDQINDWIDDIAAAYPDTVTAIIGGETYEGRQIKGLKVSHGEDKKAIFIEGGIHSREWISPATIIYMTNELITSDNAETRAVAQEFDWYIFPVTNPDGYIWTHEAFRLWRKNRRPVGDEYGIDLNRNWDNNWLVVGASTDPSSNTYAGTAPFSEPETKTLSEFIMSVGDRIELYLSFHSAGQLLLLPYGNTTEPLANYYDAMNIGRRAMGALTVRYGTQYVTGNIAEAICPGYVCSTPGRAGSKCIDWDEANFDVLIGYCKHKNHASGSSVDWVKDNLNVPLTYCYELRDQGEYHFLLPPEQIVPSGEETWDSVLDMIYQAKRFGYMNSGVGVKAQFAVLILSIVAKFF